MTKQQIAELEQRVTASFRTFGGGQRRDDNPLTHWLADAPPQLALGVPVADVVRFVLAEAQKIERAASRTRQRRRKLDTQATREE